MTLGSAGRGKDPRRARAKTGSSDRGSGSRASPPSPSPAGLPEPLATSDEIDGWYRDGGYLVRIPTPEQLARRRGFPPDRVDYAGMRTWLETSCRSGWRVQPTGRDGTVYLFEAEDDALAFALRWFPFKCG